MAGDAFPNIVAADAAHSPDVAGGRASIHFLSTFRALADIWQHAKGRLRWVCVLPLSTMSEALDHLRFAHANGAVAVFMRGPRSGWHGR
jgi:hypothetical protein